MKWVHVSTVDVICNIKGFSTIDSLGYAAEIILISLNEKDYSCYQGYSCLEITWGQMKIFEISMRQLILRINF